MRRVIHALRRDSSGILLLLALIVVASAPRAAGAAVRYVKHDAAGGNNGTSWADAYVDLQSALAVAVSGDQIWVSEGTYRPTSDTDRNIRFVVKGGVELYGGFAGTESLLSQRNWNTHVTVLSGDVGVPGNPADNTQCVIVTPYGSPGMVLDGFVIRDGNHNSPPPNQSAYGGGVYTNGKSVLRNLVIRDNYAGYGGGGIIVYGDDSSDTTWVENTIIADNGAGIRGGGIWCTSNPDLMLSNVLLLANTAGTGGGVSTRYSSGAQGTNVTFIDNTASPGQPGAIEGGDSDRIYNSILWGNGFRSAYAEFHNCLIQGSGGSANWDWHYGIDGGGNIDVDPAFIDLPAGDYHLSFSSPARDSGTNAVSNLLSIDLDGLPRIENGTVDMGIYEFHCPPDSIVRVDAGASSVVADGGSWVTAFPSLRRALASVCSTVKEIWIAEGTYRPTSATEPSGRSETFALRNGLRIYGGFAGTETSLAQRDPGAHETTLSGEILGETAADNSYHVVTANGTDRSAVLDGCTITRGFASEDAPQPMGGGLLNVGGSPTLRNIVFRDNGAGGSGGAIANYLGSAPVVVNAVFVDNWSVASGGAIYNVFSNPIITGATFEGNFGAAGAGVMYNTASSPSLTNLVIWGNEAPAMQNIPPSAPVFDHCLVQGSGGSVAWNGAFGVNGGGNIDADPLFVDAPGGDLHVALTSPAVDAGDDRAPWLPPIDIEGHPRIIGSGVDMRAYETDAVVGVGDGQRTPAHVDAYPNPFNPTLTILYTVVQRAETRLTIYDVRGTEVRELIGEVKQPGTYRTVWNNRDRDGVPVASGVYFVRLESGSYRATRKITLLK